MKKPRTAGKELKADGNPYGVYTIRIDDGFCEWSYKVKVNRWTSIEKIAKKIRGIYKGMSDGALTIALLPNKSGKMRRKLMHDLNPSLKPTTAGRGRK